MPFYNVNKYNKHLNYFCVINDVFSNQEVDQILDLEDLQKFAKGKVGSTVVGGSVRVENRDSEVMWIDVDENSQWLFAKFSDLVSYVNYDQFLFDIDGFETFQYTVYRENQHYNWHLDMGNESTNIIRKISCSIILSDPDSYEGGEFECIVAGNVSEPLKLKPKKGDVIFFASWIPHRVAPVTSGVRKSLVTWINGKR